MDDDGRELAAGDTGELDRRADGRSRYCANPEATAASFSAGFCTQATSAWSTPTASVRIVDRKKDMLNRGGFKVYSVKVENVLMGWPGVVEAAVVGVPCPVLGERVQAAFMPRARRSTRRAAPLRRATRRLRSAGKIRPERRALAAQRQRQGDEAPVARSVPRLRLERRAGAGQPGQAGAARPARRSQPRPAEVAAAGLYSQLIQPS